MIGACGPTFGNPWTVLRLLKCRNHLAGADRVGLNSLSFHTHPVQD